MFDLTRNPSRTHLWVPWFTIFALATLMWIPTLQQAWQMGLLAMPQFGTMGLALGPFLVYWTLMMGAMMLPALTPTMTLRYQRATQQSHALKAFVQMLLFICAYLAPWMLFGVPAFFLAGLGQYWVLHAPTLSLGLGIALLLISGCYQMTPLKTRFLRNCNPSLCCSITSYNARSIVAQLREGLVHGVECLGCCGALMLVMVAVGLMSVPWMLVLTLVVFLEKTWSRGARFSFFVGFALLVFAALALAEPALLSGVVRPFAAGY